MAPDHETMTANTNFILGMDIATSLRILVAQNQNGGPLTDEQMKAVRDTALVDLMPKILNAVGVTHQKLKETLGL
jgi:hypothetical protein